MRALFARHSTRKLLWRALRCIPLSLEGCSIGLPNLTDLKINNGYEMWIRSCLPFITRMYCRRWELWTRSQNFLPQDIPEHGSSDCIIETVPAKTAKSSGSIEGIIEPESPVGWMTCTVLCREQQVGEGSGLSAPIAIPTKYWP